MPFSLLKSNNQ